MLTAYSATARGFLPAIRNPGPGACENGPIAGLLDKRLAFVTGKGGVGKTTVAYALGLTAAAAGKRAIVCEIAGQERGSSLFGIDPIGFAETEIADGLSAISIDPDRMVREYLEVLLPVRAMASLLYRSNLFSYLAAATPGLQEVVSIGKAYELTLSERRSPEARGSYDIVIVDAPATGHGVGFLEAPGTFRRIARGGPLADQASRIERMITDAEASGVGIVASPEEMAVNETADLAAGLVEAGVELDEVFVNGLFPERFAAAEVDRIRTARAELASGALDAAIAEAERAQVQRIELERLRGIVAGVPIRELPFLFVAEFGSGELAVLAEELT